MAEALRVLDTGVIEGRLNIAMGQAIVEAHGDGRIADTLRFLRFPPTALVGRHQALGQEINVDFCRANGIGLARRITGGGAIYLDPGQLGWELAVHRKTLGVSRLDEVARTICEAVAAGLSSLGIEASYRPRNDIEVGGRKISGTGGFFDGDTLFYQGTVLVDMDPATMVSALRVPKAKLEKRALDSAEQRIVTLRDLLGDKTPGLEVIQQALAAAISDQLGLESRLEEPGALELEHAEMFYHEEIGRDDFVFEIEEPAPARGVLTGERLCPGGTIRCYLRLEGPKQNRIREALITGDFFATPPRLVYDLEARLRGAQIEDIRNVVTGFFDDARIDLLTVTPEDFLASLENALAPS